MAIEWGITATRYHQLTVSGHRPQTWMEQNNLEGCMALVVRDENLTRWRALFKAKSAGKWRPTHLPASYNFFTRDIITTPARLIWLCQLDWEPEAYARYGLKEL